MDKLNNHKKKYIKSKCVGHARTLLDKLNKILIFFQSRASGATKKIYAVSFFPYYMLLIKCSSKWDKKKSIQNSFIRQSTKNSISHKYYYSNDIRFNGKYTQSNTIVLLQRPRTHRLIQICESDAIV